MLTLEQLAAKKKTHGPKNTKRGDCESPASVFFWDTMRTKIFTAKAEDCWVICRSCGRLVCGQSFFDLDDDDQQFAKGGIAEDDCVAIDSENVEHGTFLGFHLVNDCPCNTAGYLELMLAEHLSSIATFILARHEHLQSELEMLSPVVNVVRRRRTFFPED